MSHSSPRSGPHFPALDGYRGVGVVFVVLFHVHLLDGGWLGVDLFFVLSGFLITRLLVMERAGSGRISLGDFWARRARRLLPALFMTLGGIGLYTWWYPDKTQLPTDLPRQMVGAVFYFSNWLQMLTSGGYWDRFTQPSPMKHLWSLSIEEQFYVVFPLIMLGLFTIVRRKARIAWLLAAAAVASWTAGVALLWSGAGFERVYLGTDTRAGAIFCGCAVGYLTCNPQHRATMTRWARGIAPFALVGIVAAMVAVKGDTDWPAAQWLVMPAFELAVAALLVVAIDTQRPSPTNAVAVAPSLRWLGTISYGLYLWHFPIVLAVDRGLIGWSRWATVPIELVLSVVVATLSFYLVEEPIRRRRMHLPRLVPAFAVILVLALAMFSMERASTVAAADRSQSEQGSFEVTGLDEATVTTAKDTTTTTSTVAVETPDTSTSSVPTSIPAPPPSTAPNVVPPTVALHPDYPLPTPPGRAPRVLLVGDSVAMFLNKALQADTTKLGVTAVGTGGAGCGIGGVAQIADAGPNPNPALVASCKKWHDAFPSLVRRAKPDVVLMEFGAIQRYTMRLDGADREPCDPQYQNWYRNLVVKEIRTLHGTGAPVAVMPMAYSRYGGLTTTDDSIDCINAATRQAVDATPGAFIMPIDEWTCPTRATCKSEVNGVDLRPDGLHFKGRGASIAMSWVIRTIYPR